MLAYFFVHCESIIRKQEHLLALAISKNLNAKYFTTIPFGAGSCVAQALAFASRGPVANCAPY